MLFKRFFVTVTWIFIFASAKAKWQSFVVPAAIITIIDEHFAKLSSTSLGKVDIVCIGSETKEFIAVMTKLLKVKSVNVKIDSEKFEFQEQLKLNNSSIIIFESLERFRADALKIKWLSNPRQRSQHLVHVPHLTTSDIIETFPDGFLVDQVNFLINETKSSIELVASYMFTERACRVQQLKIINRFNFNTKKWEKSSFYPKKYQNFHGC